MRCFPAAELLGPGCSLLLLLGWPLPGEGASTPFMYHLLQHIAKLQNSQCCWSCCSLMNSIRVKWFSIIHWNGDYCERKELLIARRWCGEDCCPAETVLQVLQSCSFCSSRLQGEVLAFPFCWRLLAELCDHCGAASLALPVSLQFPTIANRQEQPPLPAFQEGRVILELCSKQWEAPQLLGWLLSQLLLPPLLPLPAVGSACQWGCGVGQCGALQPWGSVLTPTSPLPVSPGCMHSWSVCCVLFWFLLQLSF